MGLVGWKIDFEFLKSFSVGILWVGGLFKWDRIMHRTLPQDFQESQCLKCSPIPFHLYAFKTWNKSKKNISRKMCSALYLTAHRGHVSGALFVWVQYFAEFAATETNWLDISRQISFLHTVFANFKAFIVKWCKKITKLSLKGVLNCSARFRSQRTGLVSYRTRVS